LRAMLAMRAIHISVSRWGEKRRKPLAKVVSCHGRSRFARARSLLLFSCRQALEPRTRATRAGVYLSRRRSEFRWDGRPFRIEPRSTQSASSCCSIQRCTVDSRQRIRRLPGSTTAGGSDSGFLLRFVRTVSTDRSKTPANSSTFNSRSGSTSLVEPGGSVFLTGMIYP
jgi:hypothetical protein